MVALATCADQQHSGLLLDLATSEHLTARILAFNGLRVALSAGMLACLSEAAEDSDHEIRGAANVALHLLGTRKSCELLVQMAEFDHHTAHDSLMAAGALLGVPVGDPKDREDDMEEVRDRYRHCARDLRDDVCYRSGEPLNPCKLVDELMQTRTPAHRDQLAKEIEIRSGLDVRGALLFRGGRGLADSVAGLAVEPGGSYRWGNHCPAPLD